MKIQSPTFPGLFPFKLTHAGWLTFYYLIFSITWILLSDLLAAELAGNNKQLFEKIQSLKGLFFVGLSAILLYLISRKLYLGIAISNQQNEQLQKKYQALNDAAREGFFEVDFAEKKASCNSKMKFFIPGNETEAALFIEKNMARIHPDDIERLRREYAEVNKTGKQTWKSEFSLLGADGQYYRVISNVYLIRQLNQGELVRITGAIQDISDLRGLQTEYYEQKLKHKRTLAASIIKAQENERTRWAEELHDNVCQILSVANMYANDINDHPENLKQLGPQLKKLIAESISEIRQLSATIRTPAFDNESLAEAIRHLTANINRLHTLQFRLEISQFREDAMEHEKKLMIYRIVQEQINNIIKYASADTVEICIKNGADNKVEIRVTDNGVGFDPSAVKSGIGLRNIQSRLQVYNGNLEIISAKGHGCCVHANFDA